jgi:hypothetical protein
MTEETQEKVFAYMKSRPRSEAMTTDSIAVAIGRSEFEVREALEELKKQKKVINDDLFRPSILIESDDSA